MIATKITVCEADQDSISQELIESTLKKNVKLGHSIGFSFTPLDGKKPILQGWQTRERESLETALEYGRQGNVGLRCGAVSAPDGKYLVVIDQDGGGNVESLQLPPTVTVETKNGFHYYFYSDKPMKNTAGKLGEHIDSRGEGGQVVYPGSIHPDNGHQYRWAAGLSPTDIAVADLPEHIATRFETKPMPPVPAPKTSMRYALSALEYETANVRNASEGSRNDTLNRAAFSLGTLVAAGHLDASEAENGLLSAALAAGLSRPEAQATIRSGMSSGQEHPREIDKTKIDDFILEYPEPMRIAEHYLEHCWNHKSGYLLRRYRGDFYEFDGICYRLMTDESLNANLYPHLDRLWTYVREKGERVRDETGAYRLRKIGATIGIAREIQKAIPALGVLTEDKKDAPVWLSNPKDLDPKQLLVCQNGLLDLNSCTLYPCTPEYFALNCLEYPYDPNTGPPEEWFRFLRSLWPDETESILALQEWFGYCLTTDTSQQKMLLLVGPKRSGKGTIGRVLTALLGQENIAAPTLGSLATNFGLQPLLGKQLSVISDARLSGRTDQAAVVERLLSISGEDCITIDRKNKSPLTVKLRVRFMIMTNELPRLSDASGALANRFIVLPLKNSFYGKEDQKLTSRLLNELPGILHWSIEGWRRLKERGYFKQPESSAQIMEELEDLGSPIKAFVRERCHLGELEQIEVQAIYQAWRAWCLERGIDRPGEIQVFSRNLKSAFSSLGTRQIRDEQRRKRIFTGIRMIDS